MDIESIEHQTRNSLIYVDKIENAEEFLYIKRRAPEVRGVLIYVKKTGGNCHKFSKVEKLVVGRGKGPDPISYGSGKHWIIVDEEMPCEEFDLLISLVLDHHILEISTHESFPSMLGGRGDDLIGLKTKGDVEHWYSMDACFYVSREHDEMMAKLLLSEEGQAFSERIEREAKR